MNKQQNLKITGLLIMILGNLQHNELWKSAQLVLGSILIAASVYQSIKSK